jgi:thiol-disulfide isomerase/thioredoxin
MTGIAILAVAVVAALAFGLHRKNTDGRFGAGRRSSSPERGTSEGRIETTTWDGVRAALPEAELGERATFVQFSSSFCAPCRTTRTLLADIATREDGVAHLEIDAEQHLELVRALDVRRTPTTLVLDADGTELTRASGAPRREQVLAVLPEAVR